MLKQRVRRHQQLVEHFEDKASANLGTRSNISDFCRVSGINQRTLLRAIRSIRQTTPSKYLRELRLAQVRQALLSANAGTENVTELAMRFAFHALGRFAVDYRAAFGESPSETLRRVQSTAR